MPFNANSIPMPMPMPFNGMFQNRAQICGRIDRPRSLRIANRTRARSTRTPFCVRTQRATRAICDA
eukprot:8842495-Lingulodinium_polyedra.AAC.1